MTGQIQNLPEPKSLGELIETEGFVVFQNVISSDDLQDMRKFWMSYFENDRPLRKVARGDIVLGESNFNSMSNSSFWNLYRDFEFLWNESKHQLTREINVALHKYRNLAQGFDETKGLEYDKDCYGVYLSTSHYHPGGFLQAHIDNHQNTPILHYMLPITFYGKDYTDGGMYITDKNNEEINIDARINEGDVIFFDGRMNHGVKKIVPKEGGRLGRIATFAVPTHFYCQQKVPAWIRAGIAVTNKFNYIISKIRNKEDSGYY